jgi:glycosyltransferase involved in cell wall biosynthesis
MTMTMAADDDDHPLISCILPTYNRRGFLPHAIRYFQRQDYPNTELLVVDDGADPVGDLVPADPRIRYIRLSPKITLGAKLNVACSETRGPIIAQWDDDDWYAADRLTRQWEALRRSTAEVCGVNDLLYYDLTRGRGLRYRYPAHEKRWVLGASLCFRRKQWERKPFADVDAAPDALFCWSTHPDGVLALPPPHLAVHLIHGDNVSPKTTEGSWWSDHPVADIAAVVGDDWRYYSPGSEPLSSPRPR